MERGQFTFYASFLRGISRIKSKAARCDAYDAIVRYAMFEEEPDLDRMPDAAATVFEMARPILDASRKRAESGARGGRKAEASGKQNEFCLEDASADSIVSAQANGKQTEANRKQTEAKPKQEKEQEKEQDKDKGQKSSARARAFASPSVEDVASYVEEKGYDVDPEAFVAFYASKGWKVGSQPMKDWRSAVVTWAKRRQQERRGTREPGGNPFLEMLREEGAYGSA